MIRGLLNWFHNRNDPTVVSYSRFGMPGDVVDERPAPKKIYVLAFDELDQQYLICQKHSTRMTMLVAGMGASFTIFAFICAITEFNWYTHERTSDFFTFGMLFAGAVYGVIMHMMVVRGVSKDEPKLMIPFILTYSLVIFFETFVLVFAVFAFLNHMFRSNLIENFTANTSALWCGLVISSILIISQGIMLVTVLKCRNYIEKKKIHDSEKRVAENAKKHYPNLEIIYVRPEDRLSASTENVAEVPSTEMPTSSSLSTSSSSDAAASSIPQKDQETLSRVDLV